MGVALAIATVAAYDGPGTTAVAFLLDEARSIRWDLEAPEITLGRATDSHVVLDHPSVSRRHARILATGGGHLLEDLGSSTGTTVNGVPVRQHWLVPGDLVTLGPVPLRFLAEPAPPPTPWGPRWTSARPQSWRMSWTW